MDETPAGAPGERDPTDESLLAAYREAGSDERRAAADRIFVRYYERVGRWCYRFMGDRQSAADLAQDVFLKAYLHLDSFQGTSQFGTWLYSIVRNESINRSKRSRVAMTDSDEALIHVPAPEPDPEELATRGSNSRGLHEFLTKTLDQTERTVFTLHYGDDMPLDAITRLLKLDNSSGAKAYIVSARRKLARGVEKMSARGQRL
jgi:RNA polymerase sigma-70 factor (ECF subfamily)